MNERINRVLEKMNEKGIDQLLVSDPLSIRFLTGIMVNPGERLYALLLRTSGKHTLFLNYLYYVSNTGFEEVWFSDMDDQIGVLTEHIDTKGVIGIDKAFPARFLIPLQERCPELKTIWGSDCVDGVRAVKNEEEIKIMRQASIINDMVMERAAAYIKEGMTEKQIKRMIRKEGYRFCLFGIPAGITVGIIFAYLLEPNGITIINAIATSILAIILGIIIVQISVYKPAQIASNISPIEATKYVGNDPELKESRVQNRKNHIRLSPYSLAVLSEKQNRKKHNLTIASLAIGGILFMVGATFISSWNPDSFARMGNLEDGEYYITINHNTLVNPKPYGISEYQVNTPFSQELMEELQQIPEVKEIYATERTAAIIEYHDEQLEIPIIPITPDNQEEILKTLPVDWTYETLVKQDAMVILGTSVQKEVYHACPSIGEKVTLRWFDGAEHSIDILIAGTSEKSMNEGFYLPKETIEKLWGDMDLTASLTLSVPEYEKVGKSVESKLNNILSRHPDLVMETLQEVKASSANTIHNTSVQVYGVSAFVIMFSIFNLTNTLISRISTRRKEFGILESIGMTKKQIKKMLLHESVLLIIPCLIITVVAGTLMGYLLVRILSANGLTYFQYTFPFIPLLIYGVCLIITPIIISAICLKIQCRNSLVERIKMAD